jgi:hypothetical protein
MSQFNTVKLKNYVNVFEEYDVATAAVTPGMLVELASATAVKPHATAGGNALPMFALENELEGQGVADAYAVGDKIPQVWIPQRGDVVWAILADGENVAVGDFLESNGAGLLQKHVADEASAGGAIVDAAIIGVALEAVDLSDSSGGESSGDLGYDKRIQVRIN